MRRYLFTFIVILYCLVYCLGQTNNKKECTCQDCVCVKYYLCDNKTNTIITDGRGMLDERAQGDCAIKERCCRLVREEDSKEENPLDKCGIVNPDGIGGKKVANTNLAQAESGEYPWMVGILDNKGKYQCGGSLIHPSVILTAAHCVTENKDYMIKAGEWDSSVSEDQKILKTEDRSVSSKKIHEKYNPGNLQNDIALLFLSAPLPIKAHINVACLPPKGTVVQASDCLVTGWGKDQFGQEGTYPSILKEVEVPMVAKDACQNMLRNARLGQYFRLHKSFVCAGGEEGKDVCEGDGGGPLVCPIVGQENKYQQVGVVSWGLGCKEKDRPGVYANVAYFRDWIDKQMTDKGYETTGYQY